MFTSDGMEIGLKTGEQVLFELNVCILLTLFACVFQLFIFCNLGLTKLGGVEGWLSCYYM